MNYEPELVVLVPGIYMPVLSLTLLARRIQGYGFKTKTFAYASLRASVEDNAQQLYNKVISFQAPIVHFVGHSLGGLVIRHLMAKYSTSLPYGHTVTLGTPHSGSQVALQLQEHRLGWLLGHSRCQGLLGDLPAWPSARKLGSLAGIHRHGVGRFLASLEHPHDGTVQVAETIFAGLTDHICLPVNHTTLLLDAQTAQQTAFFLRKQHFDHSMGSSVAKC